VGSRSNNNLAYIAGFLDGDGSLMLQIKKRSDTNRGVRFMATICLYQDSRHETPLHWMRSILNIGYISRRNDGISELRVNGFKQVNTILKLLRPFIKFKEKQAEALYKASSILMQETMSKLSTKKLRRIVKLILIIQNENYVAKRKRTEKDLLKMLDLTP
jgi:hypothetical protein